MTDLFFRYKYRSYYSNFNIFYAIFTFLVDNKQIMSDFAKIDALFHEIDTNKNGSLSMDEALTFFRKLNIGQEKPYGEADMVEFYYKLDANKDGQVINNFDAKKKNLITTFLTNC